MPIPMNNYSIPEREIVSRLVVLALQRGLYVTVLDEDQSLIEQSTSLTEILAEIGHSDINYLRLHSSDGTYCGFVTIMPEVRASGIIREFTITDDTTAIMTALEPYIEQAKTLGN